MTTFDLSSLRLSAGSHTIKVKAKATHLLTSEFSNAVTYDVYVQLNAPVLSLSGDIVSWVAIPNASSYTLYVDGSSYQTLISTTSADLSSLSLGEHSIQVRAIGSGYYTDSELSTAVTYTKYQQLSAPVISLSTSTLSWSAVSNASSYTLYVDSAVAQTGITSLTFDLSTLTSLSPTAHTIQLKAIGSGYYTDSVLSNSVSYTPAPQLSAPQNVSVSGTSATFDEVQNATSYEFIADGTTSIGTYALPSYTIILTNNSSVCPQLNYANDSGVDYSTNNGEWETLGTGAYDTSSTITLTNVISLKISSYNSGAYQCFGYNGSSWEEIYDFDLTPHLSSYTKFGVRVDT